MEVAGKAAVITGGGTGVGRATALELARRGCHVLINYSRSKDEAEQTAADISALGVRGIAVQADVIDDAACRRMIDTAVREFGRLDILVNNAGVRSFIKHADLEAVQLEDWNRIFSTNVIGTFQCSRAASDALFASGNGEIVNVSSVAGIAGTGSSIPYCASKAALNSLTVTLARVFAPTVRVNAVAPGFITTRWLQQGLGIDRYEETKRITEERVLLHKVCTPEDVAGAIVNVITGPDLMTGNIIPLEGGALHSNFNPR
ncbi:MAG TPA: SDR family oxidoreductase [Blastocatellia bacterium]|nr:SDR family oxidoreductase [Blastocatellia bacterium]